MTRVLSVRRYRCRRCKAVVTVVPRQVIARRHFAASAIAVALFVFGKLGATAITAARGVGSWAQGAGAWRTLRRWLGAVEAGHLFGRVRGSPLEWPPRRRAERVAVVVGAMVPDTFASTEIGRVFEGAAAAS